MAKSDKVVTVCYGTKREWASREEAMNFFLEGIVACEGSEADRYAYIYSQLANSANECSDTNF